MNDSWTKTKSDLDLRSDISSLIYIYRERGFNLTYTAAKIKLFENEKQ